MDEFIQFPQGQEAGVLTPSSIVSPDLPEEWGGRPSGTSRRAIRMQEQWDKRRAAQIEEAKAFQQMELQRKQFEIQSRDQQLQEDQFYFDREAAVAEQKLKAQQTAEAREFLGAVNSLDPRSADYRDNLIQLRRQYPLGSLDATASGIIGEYDKVHSVYMESEKEKKQETDLNEKLNKEFMVQQADSAAKYGIDINEFTENGVVNQVGLMQRIGEAQREELENERKRTQESQLGAEQRRSSERILDELVQIDDKLELAKSVVMSNASSKVKEEAANSIKIYEDQKARRLDRLKAIRGDQADLPQAISKEDADMARKTIEENPNSPQAESARQLLNLYDQQAGATPTTTQQQPQAAPQATTTPVAPTTGLRPPTEPQAPQPITAPTPAQTSSRATLDEVNAILNDPNSTPTQRAFAASKKKEIESSIARADTQVEEQRQEQERQLTESQRGWRDQIDKQITDTDWLGTITGPKEGVDPNDYFEALRDIDSKAPFELRDYLLRLGLLVGRRGTGGLTLKRNIDPKLKEAVAQEIQRKLAEIDFEDWQGLSTSPYKDLRKYIPAGLFKENK